MNKRLIARISLFVALTALACGLVGGVNLAQDDEDSAPAQEGRPGPKPMFTTLTPRYLQNLLAPLSPTVANWSGSFMTGGVTYPFTMVGTDPALTNTSTTVTAYIIPIKIVVAGKTFDPASIVSNVTASPIFHGGIDFVQGGTDLGNTQYIDAFQRGNFYGDVKTNTGYHVLLNVVVLGEQTLNVPKQDGSVGNPFGFGQVGIVNINYFDAHLQSILSGQSAITPASFPIALTENVYLSNNKSIFGCCIGGYHSAFGSSSSPQTYAHSTYIPKTGVFAEDVAALSHEVGEWVDDPFVNNGAPNTGGCSGNLEVGDSLVEHDYGYVLSGFNYHLQDLVFLDYFSGLNSLQVNGWYSFQNEKTAQCQ
ncbi:MAG TPA: hypothetical protein VG204_14100 [Terriglobia bacterium]|nr:hypothetical protein [Terriglobia bacterium]